MTNERKITDVVRLRTLTRKSIMPVGYGAGNTVQWCLEHCKSCIDWAYYTQSTITFTDDILDEMHIRNRIDKPGTNREFLERRRWAMAHSMAENGDSSMLHRMMGNIRSNNYKALKKAEEKESYHTSAERLAWVNQGHR